MLVEMEAPKKPLACPIAWQTSVHAEAYALDSALHASALDLRDAKNYRSPVTEKRGKPEAN